MNKKTEALIPQYKLEGILSEFTEGTKFYLYNLETNANVDSSIVKDSKFEMAGNIIDPPGLFWLRATDGEEDVYTPLLIGNENVKIYASKKDFGWNVRTSGSTIDSNYRKALSVTKELDIKRDSLILSYHALTDDEKEKTQSEFLAIIGRIDSVRYKKEIAYLKEGHNTYASIVSLHFLRNKIPKDSVQMIFERYDDYLKSSKYGKVISVYLEPDSLKNGDYYVNFKGLNQSEKESELFDFKEDDKFLLINYTSAYCGFCINATEELKFIYEKYKEVLTIVSLSADPQKKDWKKSVERDGDLWPSLWDGKGMYSETAIRYNFWGTPTFLLISPDGKIVDRWVGYDENKLSRELKKYMPLGGPKS